MISLDEWPTKPQIGLSMVFSITALLLCSIPACTRRPQEKVEQSIAQDALLEPHEVTQKMVNLSISGRVLAPNKLPLASASAFDRETGLYGGGVVLLDGLPSTIKLPVIPKGPIVFHCKNGGITPSFQVAIVGQEVVVQSEDQEPHNFAFHTETREPSPSTFEKSMILKRVFLKPSNFVQVSCAVHPTEQARLTVAGNGIYCVPDTKGLFLIRHNVPPGKYMVRVLSPDYGVLSKEINVTEAMPSFTWDFQFPE